MKSAERNYGIDFLKILLAIMVITIHINANGTGQVLMYAVAKPWNYIVMIVTMLCYPAVNVYILISGYYMYDAHKDTKSMVKSLSLLWLSAIFFSVLGYFISVIGSNEEFQILQLVKRFFPIIRGVWWFYTVYFSIALLSPFINKLIDNLDKIEHRMLIALLIIMLSILPIFVNWNGQLGSNYGYSLIWFIVLYITGAYLRRYTPFSNDKKKVVWGCAVYILSSMILCIGPRILIHIGIQTTFAMYNSLLVYIQAIALIVMFGNMKIPEMLHKAIAGISTLALASYLLHCDEDIEKIIWTKINPAGYANSIKIVIVAIAIVMGILISSIVLEIVRKKICKILGIDKKFVSLTNKIYEWFLKLLQIERSK